MARLLFALVALLAGCDGAYVNLGSSQVDLNGGAAGGPQQLGVWGVTSTPVVAQEADVLFASPTLTERQDEIFFSTQTRYTDQNGDPKPTGVARATLSSGVWGEPEPLAFSDMPLVDAASPAISPAGDELWLGLNLFGSTDVFHSLRQGQTWSKPELVPQLSSAADDAPRPPALDGTLLPLSSKRHGGVLYQIYFAARPSAAEPWAEPSQEHLSAVNSAAYQSADGFLSADGLALYFSSNKAQTSDLYVARRATLNDDFGTPEALADLNTDSEERMPWLSPDGTQLYFASNRPTKLYEQYALYVATKR